MVGVLVSGHDAAFLREFSVRAPRDVGVDRVDVLDGIDEGGVSLDWHGMKVVSRPDDALHDVSLIKSVCQKCQN